MKGKITIEWRGNRKTKHITITKIEAKPLHYITMTAVLSDALNHACWGIARKYANDSKTGRGKHRPIR